MDAPQPLTRRFGLDDQEADVLRDLIARFSEENGQDFLSVFERIEAGQSLAQALDLSPGVSDLLYAQAHARFNAGDHDRALSLFQTLVLLAPDRRDHWLGLGIVMRVMGRLDTARLAFEAAEKLDTEGAVARYHLAETLLHLQRKAQARRAIEAALAAPDSPGKHLVRRELERLRAATEVG